MPSSFAKLLNDVCGTPRRDVYRYSAVGQMRDLHNAQPIHVDKALKWLGVTQIEMVMLLRSGRVPPPAYQDDGVPIWRWDDLAALAHQLERQREPTWASPRLR